MDVPRKMSAWRRYGRRTVYILIVAGLIPLVTMGITRLKPAAPTVDRATVMVDTVKRGSMLREVRGLGTLVPEAVRWIPAITDGRVERIIVKPGATVKADTVLLELINPELQRDALDAEMQVKAAEAELINLRVQLQKSVLDQRSVAAIVEADYQQATLQAQADEALIKDGLVSALTAKMSKNKAAELTTRREIERSRLEISSQAVEAQLAVQRSKIEQFRALYQLRRNQVESLRVRAGTNGVLQQLPVEVGQRVTPGSVLAKVAEPQRLKAEIKIAETQAKDIQIGQPATVDTRNGVVSGQVMRIDPAVQNGTVTVDVVLQGELPPGARPDLSVDGTIELERLTNVLYVGRPVQGQSTVTLFKLEDKGQSASRVRVKFGRSSVNTIEIIEGLQVGDQVILSDLSTWDAVNRILLN